MQPLTLWLLLETELYCPHHSLLGSTLELKWIPFVCQTEGRKIPFTVYVSWAHIACLVILRFNCFICLVKDDCLSGDGNRRISICIPPESVIKIFDFVTVAAWLFNPDSVGWVLIGRFRNRFSSSGWCHLKGWHL